ncbi:MAG: DSD1 family PLP-dependent enzyme [Planctomycetaceae bacterium]|nr:DSD1 family PLP-dependent enzyme [Planctomycetaceae bacterium]
MPESPISQAFTELDTPAYCLDIDTLETNIDRMASFLAERGKQWRPHAKCHKTPEVAKRQVAAGATGVTVAKVSEAEVYADAGITDILIANLVVGPQKLARLAELCREANPVVCCDHFAQAEALSEVCQRAGVTCRVVIEMDIGMNRVGVRPGKDTLELAQAVDRLPGIDLVGVMGYEGHLLTIEDVDQKRREINAAIGLLANAREAMLAHGICCDIVSAGGTGSYQITADCDVVTELQAGGGVFADPFYLERCGVTGLEPSLRLVATVVSRPSLERAIIDAGRKALHWDIYPPQVHSTAEGRSLPDAVVKSLSAEHGTIELGPQSRDIKIGDKLLLIPGYSDHTTVLHDEFQITRNGRVEMTWPIVARGMLR